MSAFTDFIEVKCAHCGMLLGYDRVDVKHTVLCKDCMHVFKSVAAYRELKAVVMQCADCPHMTAQGCPHAGPCPTP